MSTTAEEQAQALQQAEKQIDFDPETVDLETLRQEALRQAAEQQDEPQQQQEQARDDKGRFVGQNAPNKGVLQNENEQVQEVDAVEFSYEIDLGDGSGVQIFRAATQDELIKKLGKAQENATRKIRELTTQRQQPVQEEPKELTPEEKWLLSQEFSNDPRKAFEKEFERTVGMPMSSFKTKMQRLEAFEKAQSEETAASQFRVKHPEYHATPKNATKIERYIEKLGLDGTDPASIEKAYLDLNESGLLEVKSAETEVTEQEPEAKPQTRIASQQSLPARQTRVSSGISAKRSVTQRGSAEPTEEDLYSMPLDKLRQLAISEANN